MAEVDIDFDEFLRSREDDDEETKELDELLEDEGVDTNPLPSVTEESLIPLNDNQEPEIKEESILDIPATTETEIEINSKVNIPPAKPKKSTKERFTINFSPPTQEDLRVMKEEDKKLETSLTQFLDGKLKNKKKEIVKRKKITLTTEDEKQIIDSKLESIVLSLMEKFSGHVVPKVSYSTLRKQYKGYEKNKKFFKIDPSIQRSIISLEYIHQNWNEKFLKFVTKANRYKKQRDMVKKVLGNKESEIVKLKKSEKLMKIYEKRLKEVDKDFLEKLRNDKSSKVKETRTSKLFGFFGV